MKAKAEARMRRAQVLALHSSITWTKMWMNVSFHCNWSVPPLRQTKGIVCTNSFVVLKLISDRMLGSSRIT